VNPTTIYLFHKFPQIIGYTPPKPFQKCSKKSKNFTPRAKVKNPLGKLSSKIFQKQRLMKVKCLLVRIKILAQNQSAAIKIILLASLMSCRGRRGTRKVEATKTLRWGREGRKGRC
jgi:hypothetical protein